MISFITTPTRDWLEHHASKCSERFLVASPYVGDYLVKVARRLPTSVNRVLLTRTDLRDFAKGSSDIDAVCETAKLGAKVLSLPRLHAKVYVFDARAALVTSANATYSGMRRNWECGVAIGDELGVCSVARLLLSGFGSTDVPQTWSLRDLEKLRGPVVAIRKSLPAASAVTSAGFEEHLPITLPQERMEVLSAALPAWTRLTLEGIFSQPGERFDIHDVYRTCLPIARKRFPGNRFPREKLRQQLQRVRDLGIIEFLGEGLYRRTLRLMN
jgi:hypothetical protein